MKDRQKFKIQVLRMMLSELSYADSTLETSGDDKKTEKILILYYGRLLKSLDDYPEGFEKDAIKQEIELVQDYLPEEAAGLEFAIDKVLGNTEERRLAPLVSRVQESLGPQVDGTLIKTILIRKLGAT